ncbi:hypothetical protein AG1IA_01062 [Rhizoctonia solani AG-1 IA]|uniref:Uncharacterized protein n=1 Tax=Thanatephorus cucumeris (strain AG1-IA) TaxID=983506 RepID=L8X731_THACA|nr:hypothetical protein AG1IA_01062 [Rhizoctonia solani AG-1 IA]
MRYSKYVLTKSLLCPEAVWFDGRKEKIQVREQRQLLGAGRSDVVYFLERGLSSISQSYWKRCISITHFGW